MQHTTFMSVVDAIRAESKAKRAQVGAIIVKDDRIVSTGYNGTPCGFPNECEDEHGKTKSTVIHAEQNAILFAARMGISTDRAALYCSLSPCTTCAISIIQSGIKSVYYREAYRNSEGLDVLTQGGVSCQQLET